MASRNDILNQRYFETCARAATRSQEFACTVHVYATLTRGTADNPPEIDGYGISDWYDGATVAQFTNGTRD